MSLFALLLDDRSVPRPWKFWLAAAPLLLLLCSVPAAAQTLTVAIDGTSVATGTITKTLFKNSCDQDTNETGDGINDEIVTLNWTPSTNGSYQVFWTLNSGDCSSTATTTDDGGTQSQPTPLANSSIGTGLFAFTKRALLRDINNVPAGTSPCEQAPLTGTAYVCVTENVTTSSTLNTSTETVGWYFTFEWDTTLPAAPGGACGSAGTQSCCTPGDSDLNLSWTYNDSVKVPDHFLLFYQPDPTAVPSGDGGCVGASGVQLSRVPYHFFDFDGGCTPIDDAGDCADAGADDAGFDSGTAMVDLSGVCNGCAAYTDCAQVPDSLCLLDRLGNSYCAPPCDLDGGLDGGGNYSCPAGFLCQQATGIGNFSGVVCVPADNTCRPSTTVCGTCTLGGTDCGSGGLCVPSPDGGANYCATTCSDGGVNADAGAASLGDGGCLGDTVCQRVSNGAIANVLCAPASLACYDPTSLAAVLDGGGLSGATDAGPVDAGPIDAGDFNGSVAGWSSVSIPGDSTDTSFSGQISGLDNGQCYDVVLQTILSDGTAGDLSPELVAAPVMATDFWRLYQASGGKDQGGLHCQSGGGAVGILGALAAGLALRARRRGAGASGDRGADQP